MRTLKEFFQKTKDTLLNTCDFFIEHWLRYVFIILLFLILSFLLLFITKNIRIYTDFIHIDYIYDNEFLIDQKLYIYGLSLEIWLTFYTLLSFIIAGFFALFQYDKSKKKKQQEKGSEISYNFSDRIALKLSIICFILKDEKIIKDNILPLNPFSFKNFDYDELKKKIKHPKKIIKEYRELIDGSNIQEKYKNICNTTLSENEKQHFPPKFRTLIDTTLNELESICMDISSTVAGSQFIYPSLHQLFLDTIHLLYLHISSINTTDKIFTDKYFTNIIYVYNEWNNIRFNDLNKRKKIHIKIKKINEQKEKQINKAKKVKIKRV